jgi:hypothetical protein
MGGREMAGKAPQQNARAQRLARRLRENLKRRKAQARSRAGRRGKSAEAEKAD